MVCHREAFDLPTGCPEIDIDLSFPDIDLCSSPVFEDIAALSACMAIDIPPDINGGGNPCPSFHVTLTNSESPEGTAWVSHMGEGCSAVLIIDVPNMCDGRELGEHIPIWAFSMSYPIGSVARNDKCGKLSFAINISYNCKIAMTRHNATYTGLRDGLEGETYGVYFSNCRLMATGKPIAVEPFVVAEFSVGIRWWNHYGARRRDVVLKAQDGNDMPRGLANDRDYYRNGWYRPVFGYEAIMDTPIKSQELDRLHPANAGIRINRQAGNNVPCDVPLLQMTIELTPNANIRGKRGPTGQPGDWGPDVKNCYTVLVEYKGNCNRVCFVRPKAYYVRQTPRNVFLTVAIRKDNIYPHVVQGFIQPGLCSPLEKLNDGSFRYKGPNAVKNRERGVTDNIEKGDCINELKQAYNNLRSYY